MQRLDNKGFYIYVGECEYFYMRWEAIEVFYVELKSLSLPRLRERILQE